MPMYTVFCVTTPSCRWTRLHALKLKMPREWLADGAIRVNGEKMADADLSHSFALFDRYYLLQRGKKQFALIKLS